MPDDTQVNPQMPLGAPGEAESMHETACSCAEEFARMGHDGPKILRMFQNPFYAGAYRAYRALGHAATAAIIDKCLAGTGRSRVYGQTAEASVPQKTARTKTATDTR
ncbi:MAG: hypothetical protein ACHQ9S_11205 [Candidatus Binatia bacterium]